MLFRSASSSAAPPPHPAASERGGRRLLAVYALAHAGGVLSYLPLLVLLLPIKVARVAGSAQLDVLTVAVIGGAMAASASNLLFGWLSDRDVRRGRGRRRGLAAGLAATVASYALFAVAENASAIVVAIMLFQVAVNALLAPLFALMADEVPDARKGVAGGLMTLGVPLASVVSTLLVSLAPATDLIRVGIVAAAVATAVVPLLILPPTSSAASAVARSEAVARRRDFALAWTARLLVQSAGNVLFVYLLFYFATLAADMPMIELAPRVAAVQTVAFMLPIPVALLFGLASDRTGRRKPFLVASALMAAGGLGMMAVARSWEGGVAGFATFAAGSAVFLGLNTAFVMQRTSGPTSRGRELGLLNLANTLPALAGPVLTWSLVTPDDFTPAMWALAAATGLGGLVALLIREAR